MASTHSNTRPAPDRVITDIADYVDDYRIRSKLAIETAHYCLIDRARLSAMPVNEFFDLMTLPAVR